jgi:hypothetical protein
LIGNTFEILSIVSGKVTEVFRLEPKNIPLTIEVDPFNTNKFTLDSSSGNVYVDGNVTINGAGGTNYSGYTSQIVFKNTDDVLGFLDTTDTINVTDRLLGYNSSTGVLEFSSLIDGGTY